MKIPQVKNDDKAHENPPKNFQVNTTLLLPFISNIEEPSNSTGVELNMMDDELIHIIQQAESENH